MKPIQAILRKESRQQGALALAMVLFCLLIQMSAFILSLFPEFGNTPDYFAIAVFVTALFTGAAAAISFAGEQDEHTFGFLRSLPVSAKSIFLGKAAWIVLGTVVVLLGTLLLAGLWTLLAPESSHSYGRFNSFEIVATFGIGILEAFIWGLFWSPRCRSQVYALLATYFCASTAGYFCAIYVRGGTNFAEIYSNAIPLRLTVLAVVGVLAVRGGLHWFDFWKQGHSKVGFMDGVRKIVFGHLPFPKRIQSPFFSLLHQGFRQSQLFLLVGFVSGIAATVICFDQRYYLVYSSYSGTETRFLCSLFLAFATVYYAIFCGSLFGADQKNGVYRFFGRCGVRPGMVWWSRILPGLFVAAPFLLALLACFFGGELTGRRIPTHGFLHRLNCFLTIAREPVSWQGMSTWLTIWLVPFSCGAMLSISVKRMIVAVALTGAASGFLLFWMVMGFALFGLSPLWTTLPLCLALLVASRLQAENWIRERTGWRRFVKTLLPFFATGAVVLAAVPVVRVYSIPFIPLAEVERIMDSADLVERLSPTERRALFHEVAANRNKPLPPGEPIRPLIDSGFHDFMMFQGKLKSLALRHDDPEIVLKTLQAECRKRELQMETTPKFEEWLLRNYEINYRMFHTKGEIPIDRLRAMYRFCPWENERMLRRFTALLVIAIEGTDRMPPGYKSSAVIQRERQRFHHTRFTPLFDDYPWEWQLYTAAYFHSLCYQRLYLTHHSLQLWYLERDETLPESLDELVAEGYLKKIPTDPRTGKPMQYVRDFDESQIEKNRHQILSGTKPGWPNLEFGRIGVNEIRVDLRFLPGYDEYGQMP